MPYGNPHSETDVDPNKKEAFEQLCLAQDLTPSLVICKMIREYLQAHQTGTRGGCGQKRLRVVAGDHVPKKSQRCALGHQLTQSRNVLNYIFV